MGEPYLVENLKQVDVHEMKGLSLLQVVSARNLSAPISKPMSQACPRMVGMVLSDGSCRYTGVEYEPTPLLRSVLYLSLSLSLPPNLSYSL